MAVILENTHGRRMIRMTTDDILSVVREYQAKTMSEKILSYQEIRNCLDCTEIYIPEDLF